MADSEKYHRILNALQELMENRDIRSISVSEIAQKAGIGKGSIYYYFPSKDAIFDALVERSYQESLETAKSLAAQRELSPFTRMALLFKACRSSSSEFLKREAVSEQKQNRDSGQNPEEFSKPESREIHRHGKARPEPKTGEQSREQKQEQAYVHRKFLTYVIHELKPVLTEIIRQGIDENLLHFEDPDALSEIVLIVLAVKLDNYLTPSTHQETEKTIRGLILLLESGTGIPAGTLDFLARL